MCNAIGITNGSKRHSRANNTVMVPKASRVQEIHNFFSFALRIPFRATHFVTCFPSYSFPIWPKEQQLILPHVVSRIFTFPLHSSRAIFLPYFSRSNFAFTIPLRSHPVLPYLPFRAAHRQTPLKPVEARIPVQPLSPSTNKFFRDFIQL